MPSDPIFHIALPVNDLDEARAFYTGLLGCTERPEKVFDGLITMNFFGAQLALLEAPDQVQDPPPTDLPVPVKHFGIIMEWDDWHAMVEKLKAAKVDFVWGPEVNTHDAVGEVGNLFFNDPSGNSLEFKSYRDRSKIL